MHSDSELFIDFINHLKFREILDDNDLSAAFKYLDGVDGVLRDGLYISGYENLAWRIAEVNTFQGIKSFIEDNADLLQIDYEHIYFFSQALLDTEKLTKEEREELICVMPTDFRIYLKKKFSGPFSATT